MQVSMRNVMISGLPGKMGREVAKVIIENGVFHLSDIALSGSIDGRYELLNKEFTLFPRARRNEIELSGELPLVVDYTSTKVVHENVDFYCQRGLNFVMGTTGGNLNLISEKVRESGLCAVIAPNMAKKIVSFEATLNYLIREFPNLYKDCKLEIIESHQSTKEEVSATALRMAGLFRALGAEIKDSEIISLRKDKEEQRRFGVPEKALGWHAWHKFTVTSGDGNQGVFWHKMNGGRAYAEGTLDALRFLDRKIREGERGKVYSMLDVMANG